MSRKINEYYDFMDKIESNIKNIIEEKYEEVKQRKVISKDVINSLYKDDLDEMDFYNLISDEALDFIDEMAEVARKKRVRFFGNNVNLFSPIYISNYCENSCKYCGFRSKNDIKRKKLNFCEIELEMKALKEMGIEDVLILTGESAKFSPISYISQAVKIAKTYFKTIGIEIYPANIDDYKILKKAGADFVTVFQESYDKKNYDFYHPSGHKRIYEYRIDTQERALLAGLRGVGFGTLFGLSDPIKEAFMLTHHAKEIQRKYPQAEISISLPRIRPTHGAEDLNYKDVSDLKLFQIMLAIRIYLPFVTITISTRESKKFRDKAVIYAATKISASVDTSIGNRSKKNADTGEEQFEINDKRTSKEVYEDLKKLGLSPVFTDYIDI